jgi:hypothetical protein
MLRSEVNFSKDAGLFAIANRWNYLQKFYCKSNLHFSTERMQSALCAKGANGAMINQEINPWPFLVFRICS